MHSIHSYNLPTFYSQKDFLDLFSKFGQIKTFVFAASKNYVSKIFFITDLNFILCFKGMIQFINPVDLEKIRAGMFGNIQVQWSNHQTLTHLDINDAIIEEVIFNFVIIYFNSFLFIEGECVIAPIVGICRPQKLRV